MRSTFSSSLVALALLAVSPTSRAEMNDGTVLIFSYTIEGPNQSVLGHVVVTADNYAGGTWTAGREYWFWAGTPFPDAGFALKAYGSTPPSFLDPDEAIQLDNGSFPYNTYTCDTDGDLGRWFRLERNLTTVGWVQDLGEEGLHWFILGDTYGHAPPRFPLPSTTQGTFYLGFVGVEEGPESLSNCSDVLDEP